MIQIIFFLIFLKLFLFWLWLWQLKEYHSGRFLAHFKEGQVIKKILSSFWRLKYPKFTKKIIAILFTSLILAILMFSEGLYFPTFLLILFIPLIFQIPTVIWRKRFLTKARKKREQFPNLLVIGITGSYGKTSTKEFLYAILAEKFGADKILKTKDHQNSEVGISQCILNDLRPEHKIFNSNRGENQSSAQQVFICEMGAYGRGGIKLLCDIVKPEIGILTGINEQHMATFGSQENIIKTKYELIESLPQDGLAIFNGLNPFCQDLYEKTKEPKKITIIKPYDHKIVDADVWAMNIRVEKESISFLGFAKNGDSASFKVNLLGFQNVENILLAVCCALQLGMNLEEISKACEKITPKQGAMKLLKNKDGLNIIDSTYSANPDGVIADLDYLKIWRGKKIIVMPCLIELGSSSKEIHQRIGRKISEVCDLAIITTKDRFKEIKEEAGEKAIFLENPKEIFEKIKNFCNEGDVILLESRVPKQLIEQITNNNCV